MKKITGKLISTPVVLKDGYTAIVLIMVETQKGCQEFYKDSTITEVAKLINSDFSKVALSAVGDIVEFDAETTSSGKRIWHFKNVTHNF